MKFLRLPDPLLSVLFEDSDIIAIDKPYGFNAHTNDSKVEHSDYIQDGLIEIYEKQLNCKLHIIHRLDQTTTGVMIFGKSVESAKKYADYFFNRRVKKTYWFVTKHKSLKKSFFIDQAIVHKGRELEATTDLVFKSKSECFELWEAFPHTGRNHQIRIHAQAAGLSILGDIKYSGHHYPFLCLHNHKIEFPNGLVIISKDPVYFNDLKLLEDPLLTTMLFEADRRQRLFTKVDHEQCFRLLHFKDHPISLNFTIDRLGEFLVLNWFGNRVSPADVNRFSQFVEIMQKPLIVKFNANKTLTEKQDDIVFYPKNFLKNATQEWFAKENHIKYILRQQPNSTIVGLSLNQRIHRHWIVNNSHKKSVLNIFAHTGASGLAAQIGDASHVTIVDHQKSALSWAKDNFELNNGVTGQVSFLLRDSLSFIEQCVAKNKKFDLIICDTPSFFRREKGFFKIDSDLDQLLESCFACLNNNGHLLFSTTSDSYFIDDLRLVFLRIQKKIKNIKLVIYCLLPALDFELPDEKVNLKSFCIQIIKE